MPHFHVSERRAAAEEQRGNARHQRVADDVPLKRSK
jgi:hypothetical protein